MNASTIVADRLIERGIYLERYKSGFNRQILDALETLEDDLTKELAIAFSKGVPNMSARIRRLENLLADTRDIIKTAYKGNAQLAGDELLRLAQNEQTYVVGAMNHAMGIDLAGSKIVLNPLIVGATARQIASGIYDRTLNYDELKALTDGTLIQGAKSAEWWSRQSLDLQQKFSDQMRAGVLRGETLDQLVARVRGTQARLYTDGIMQGTRRNVQALVRSSVQAVANSTRLATFEANSDLIAAIQWLSVLDSRTCWDSATPVLMADGSQKRIGDIHEGEFVTGGLSGKPCRVLGSVRTAEKTTLRVSVEGVHVGRTTEDHRLLTYDGWKPAKYFCERTDEKALCRCHEQVTSFGVTASADGGETEIVSLTIEGDESYVAGGIIVHNTPICMALSGKMWELETYKPIGHDKKFPGTTAHVGCRSTQTSVLKSFKDIQAAMGEDELDAEFKKQLEKQGFSPDEIPNIKRNTRASMDGQVPADITFDKWLGGKTPAFQDELLGKGRGKLFRDGKITLTDLIDQSGRPLTIDELERLSQPRPKVRPPKL